MKKNIYKEKIILISLFFYFLTLFMIPNSTLYLNQNYVTILEISKNIFLVLNLVFIVFFNRYNMDEIIVTLVTLILFIIIKLIAGVSPLLDLLFLIVAIKEVPLKKILKVYLSTQVISFTFILMLNYFGVIPARYVIRGGVMRSSLGFWHPNTAGLMLLSILLLLLYFTKGFKKLLSLVVINIINAIMFISTDSRTSLYLIIITTLITVVTMFLPIKKSFFLKSKWVVPILFMMITIVSVLLSVLYTQGNSIAIQISIMLTNRISIGSRFLSEYGISLFGQKVEYNSPNYLNQVVIGFEYRVLDNMYLKYIINYGLVSLVSLIGYLILISKKLSESELFFWNTYVPIFLFLGFTEQGAFNYAVNFFMLFGVLLFDSTKEIVTSKINERERLI